MSDGFLGVPPQILAGVPQWKANTTYQAGQLVISPGGDPVTAKNPFTSAATYNPANWNPSTQDGRIGAVETHNTGQDDRLDAIEGTAVFDSYRTSDTTYAHAWTDTSGRVPLGIRTDGTVEAANGIDAPHAGKNLGTDNALSFAVTSTDGLIGELALGVDGCVPSWVLSRWSTRMGVPVIATRTTAIALTHASGTAQTDTRTAVQVRIPVRLGANATIKKIHFRNYEDRSGLAYTGALSFTGVAWGESARTASGQLNGNFTAAPTSLSGAFTTPTDGTEYALSGLNVSMKAGTDYLLSYGYTCAAQTNQSGVGGSWTNTTPGNVTATTDTLTLGKFSPLDVWLEIETTAPIVAWCGDSLSCGVSAEIPGYQSVPMIHGRANGVIPLMYTHSGSAMTSWVNAGAVKYTKWSGLSKPDALVMSLSKNDFLTTTDMAVMRTRFENLYPILTDATTKNMYLTTCMPNASEADATGTAERAWNDILLNEQLGNAVNVFDLRKAVTATAGGLDPVYDSGDGVHLNKRGYAAAAVAITHPLTGTR